MSEKAALLVEVERLAVELARLSSECAKLQYQASGFIEATNLLDSAWRAVKYAIEALK